MNKVFLSLALTFVLVSVDASAATVLKKDDFTWRLRGDFQVQLRQKSGIDQDLFIDYDDAELRNSFVYSLGDGVKAFAQVDYDIEKEASEEVYLGVRFGGFRLAFGDTDLPSDGYGHESEYEGSSFEDAFPIASSDNQIRIDYAYGKSQISVAKDVGDKDERVALDFEFITEFSGFDLGVAYQDYIAEAGGDAVATFGVALGGSLFGVGYGVDYSENDSLEVLHFETDLKVTVDTLMVLGYEMAEEEGVDIDSWYLNATKSLRKNVDVIVELDSSNKESSDVGFILGMRVRF